jgi:hypothetical protein
MDKTKRDKIVAEFKKYLNDKNFKGATKDPAVQLIKRMVANPENLQDENGSFNFDYDICCNECDGNCCMLENVIISPVDVDNMMRSPFLKGKDRSEVVLSTLNLFLGRNSRIPMATIRFIQPQGTNLNICPFSIIPIKAKGGKLETFNCICTLGQLYKPAVCMLFPLGRTRPYIDGKMDDEWIYFAMDCPGTKTNNKVKIKDHIRGIDEKTWQNDEYISFMVDLIKEMDAKVKDKDTINNILGMFLQVFYLSDKPMQEKIQDVRQAIDFADKILGNRIR